MKSTKILLLLVLLLIPPLVIAVPNFNSLFFDQGESRGMLLYFTALVVLLAIPLLSKRLKTLSFYIIAFFLSRGLMRITGEQDPIRVIYSIWPGLRLGLLVAVPLILISVAITAFFILLRKTGATISVEKEEIVEYIKSERKKGKSLEQITHELMKKGIKKEDIQEAISSMEGR